MIFRTRYSHILLWSAMVVQTSLNFHCLQKFITRPETVVENISENNDTYLSDGEIEVTDMKTVWYNLEHNTSNKVYSHFPRQVPVKQEDITVAVHASANKLNRLMFLTQRWGGPVSAAVYVQGVEDIDKLNEFQRRHRKDLLHTEIHVLVEKTVAAYPHNILRQMALDMVKSDFFLTLDVDFVTPPNAFHGLMTLIEENKKIDELLRDKILFVLPAFEVDTEITEDQILLMGENFLPDNKEQVLEMVEEETMTPFHVEKFAYGHGPTKFRKWYVTSKPASWIPYYFVDYAAKFEPYVLGYKGSDLPKYWEGFRGYGYNKWTWIFDAYFSGFQYAVLKDWFVAHLDHEYGERKISASKNEFHKFKRYIRSKYDWCQDEYESAFASLHYFERASYDGPENVPRIVEWKKMNSKFIEKGIRFSCLLSIEEDYVCVHATYHLTGDN